MRHFILACGLALAAASHADESAHSDFYADGKSALVRLDIPGGIRPLNARPWRWRPWSWQPWKWVECDAPQAAQREDGGFRLVECTVVSVAKA